VFKKVTSRVSFPQMEEEILRFWKEADIFRKSGEQGHKGRFMLYEGPPTANGSPGIHHVLARVFKDIICRYKTMQGYRPLRKGGWDTHGLPVELEVERELGLKSKRDIEEYGIERFNQKCRESVFRYVKEWEGLTDRIGYWVDLDHPYVTLDNSYIESVWWILKQLWDKDLIYKGVKATPHCPRCVTSLSSHEVAQGYEENTPDPSVYVKFPILWDGPKAQALRHKLPSHSDNAYLLAWTTTPWTLPGNTALAVSPHADYSVILQEDPADPQVLILASALVPQIVKTEHQVVATIKGGELEGITYQKLYDPAAYGVEISQFHSVDGGAPSLKEVDGFTPKVILGDFVSMEDGTGIVHIAPAFGEEDLNAGRRHGLAFVQQVDLRGLINGTYPFAGKFVKNADEDIMADLSDRGLLYHRDVYHHTYPFCWRCKTPLLYYAKESWYIRTTALKERLISGNQEINWYPEHTKEGRFGEWLQNGVDWAISRERYWGTPIPLWQCQSPGCGHYHFIGTVAELKATASAKYKDRIDGLDLHRPYVDDISFDCPQCSGTMARIPEVMDAWFDSGAMPLAQWNVTSESDLQTLRDDLRFPADYICEAVDQTRGWFYSLLAISILVADEPSYRNVICLGHILDEKGRKMSKSQGNVVRPFDVLNAHGADATRWYLFTATQPGDSRRFSQDLVNEVVRRFMLTLWNVYSFFVTYAEIDDFDPNKTPAPEKPTSELDRWILSELSSLTTQVDAALDTYDPTTGGRRIQEFVDLLSNWYVRRSRRRFWRSENDDDKLSAYHTLYTCLVTLSKLMAPYTPFLAEEMYRNLVRSVDAKAPESVHLAPFPTPDPSLLDQPLMDATRLAMRISSLGRDARSRAGKKVRLPLQRLRVRPRETSEETHIDGIREQVLEELNVKEMDFLPRDDPFYKKALEEVGEARSAKVEEYQVVQDSGYLVALDTSVTPELAREGLAREMVHRIQNMRKAAGFEVTDRILSYYRGPQEVRDVMTSWGDYIRRETLSQELDEGDADDGAHVETQKLEGMELILGVKRVT
jgi:isoleucyl-tRNA synthetase